MYDEELPCNLYFVEYNLGFQLSNYFNIPYNNNTSHAATPNECYSNIFQTIRHHHITLKELTEGSINSIYRRIIYDYNRTMINFKSYRILCKVLPSYLQSFNYKVHFNLLPVKSIFREWQLDNDSCCYFCKIGPETTPSFWNMRKIKRIVGTIERS